MSLGDIHFYLAPKGHDWWKSRRAPVLIAIQPIGDPMCYSRDGNVWEDESKHYHYIVGTLGFEEVSDVDAERLRNQWRLQHEVGSGKKTSVS